MAGARSRVPAWLAPDHGHDHGDSPAAEDSSGSGRAAAVGEYLGSIEQRLRAWPVVGFALLVCMGLLLWLLTGPGS